MSRFTRPPFHKPSPFDIPRPVHPLSPPETEITTDSIPLPPMRVDTPESYHPTVAAADTSQSSSYAQTQNGRFRPRAPNLGYVHHPGTARNDLRTAPRSATRWLVMVIPPLAVAREYGNGMFLNASSHSLQGQGVLLPLLPSLSGQLTAIAREFAFPSTTGICVYLQMSDSGVQFAPRISDESWSILWGAAFDERQSVQAMGGLPIAGRIEFDLDLRKARWFDMWLTSVKRNSVDMGSSIGIPGSYAPNHRHEESRTTTFETAEDSVNEDVSATIQRIVPVVRHVPRKLSLLDRVDISSIKPSPKPASRIAKSPIDAEQPRVALSPAVQTPIAVVPVQVTVEDDSSDEPRTAIVVRRVDVERKVENWRASSSFAKSPLASTTGQTALDPANMPNNHPLVEVEGDELQPLNLDDFTWSISSAGPVSADYRDDIPLFDDTDRPPSVHLDARLEGSVCLTPTTCTSWGPSDYDYFSPVESFIDRLPSPDIAARQYDDAPPTPLTATSWGPLSEYPDSPASLYRAPSIDIAARELGSRPVTPSTATSWGPPLDWPDSPAEHFRVLSPDVAARQLESRPATPSTDTSWGPPLDWPATPATPFRVETPGIGSMFFDGMDEEDALLEKGRALFAAAAASDDKPLGLLLGNEEVYQEAKPWKFVWPYHQTESAELQKVVSVRIQPKYPCMSLYPAVYPHFDLYPTQAACRIVDGEQPNQQGGLCSSEEFAPVPTAKPWKHVWPYQKIMENISRPISVRVKSTYPSFDLYPAVYPYFDLYPANPLFGTLNRQVNTQLEPKYPFFSIYPAVYPNFEIYPGHVVETQKNPQELIEIRLEPKYPCIQPYPAVYPCFELYPEMPPKPSVEAAENRQPPCKWDTPIHAEESQAQKASPWKHVWPYQYIETSPRPVEMRPKSKYPFFDLYPAIYPHFDLYPEQPLAVGVTKEVCIKLKTKYPAFSIYPAVYPNFEIYPGYVVEAQKDPRGWLSVKLRPSYPSMEVYSPVYPHLVIYREITIREQPMMMTTASHTAGSVPSEEIASQQVAAKPPASSTVATAYPNLDIYPAVYPYFDIYRSGKPSTPKVLKPARVSLNAKYPVLEIYYPVYPYFDIYKSGQFSDLGPLITKLATKLEAKYPAFDIYPTVYPNFEIYPSVGPTMHSSPPVPLSRRRPRNTHQDLVAEALANEPQAPPIPRISISSHETRRQRPKRTHTDLVELVFPKHMQKQGDVAPSPRIRRSANVPRDVKETAAAVAAASTVASRSNSASPTSRTGVSRLPSGIPVRPSEIRRSVSLREGTMSSSQGVSRSHSMRQLPSVREEAPGNRTSFLDLDRQRRSPPSVLMGERKPLMRDSIVLEKARHWGAAASDSKSVPRPLDNNSSRVSIKDLSEFPMPPLPPFPSLPNSGPSTNGRTVPVPTATPSTQRPVSKLDRTRFPFQ